MKVEVVVLVETVKNITQDVTLVDSFYQELEICNMDVPIYHEAKIKVAVVDNLVVVDNV